MGVGPSLTERAQALEGHSRDAGRKAERVGKRIERETKRLETAKESTARQIALLIANLESTRDMWLDHQTKFTQLAQQLHRLANHVHYAAVITDVTETLRGANIDDPAKTVADYIRESEAATATFQKLSEIVHAGDKEACETRAQQLMEQYGAATKIPIAPEPTEVAFNAEIERRMAEL